MIARTSEQPRRAPLAALTLIVSAVLVLSGCAAGQRAQTAIETPAVDGVGASVGAIDIRNLSVAPPLGGAAYLSAQLQGAIVNNAGSADELVSVTTKAATSVSIYDSKADAAAGASGTASAASTSSASPSKSAQSSGSVTIPAGSLISIGGSDPNGPVIVLNDLVAPLEGASQVSVTFTFKTAGSVTLQIGVHVPTSPLPAPTLPTTVSTAE